MLGFVQLLVPFLRLSHIVTWDAETCAALVGLIAAGGVIVGLLMQKAPTPPPTTNVVVPPVAPPSG